MKLSVAAVALAMGMAFTAEAAPQAVPTAAPLQKRVFPTGNKDVSSFLATVEPDQLSSYFSDAAHGDADFTTHAESFTSVNAAAFSSYLSEKSIDPAQASAILGGIAGGAAAGMGMVPLFCNSLKALLWKDVDWTVTYNWYT